VKSSLSRSLAITANLALLSSFKPIGLPRPRLFSFAFARAG